MAVWWANYPAFVLHSSSGWYMDSLATRQGMVGCPTGRSAKAVWTEKRGPDEVDISDFHCLRSIAPPTCFGSGCLAI